LAHEKELSVIEVKIVWAKAAGATLKKSAVQK
jgi:hypothetical protein